MTFMISFGEIKDDEDVFTESGCSHGLPLNLANNLDNSKGSLRIVLPSANQQE